MATRKQQRRKYQRAVAHARHVDGDEAEQRDDGRAKADKKQAVRARGEPLEPSAKRTAKRALIFATLFYLVISFTGGSVSPAVKLANTAVMFVLFWSIGTITETFAWRRWQKKHGGSG